ncbi:MAG: helix-turn-helix transcriptional regulator [Armatimonadota bacterium]
MRPERELLKGSTPTLILAVLENEPRHGYAIAREIERRSESTLSLGEGSLYPQLHALEKAGLIAGAWEMPPGGGPSRKVYTLTATGHSELVHRTRSWRDFVSAIEGVLKNGGEPDVQPI